MKSPLLHILALALLIASGTPRADANVDIGYAPADPGKGSPEERQRQLIAILKSNAKPAEKGVACKRLAVYGTKDAVPVLAPLLADEHLASWARIALEAIPGSAPDAALRTAARKLHGNLLVGVINSIGVRRDAKAIGELSGKLKDSNAEVASAAAVALGRIGGAKAAKTLTPFLAKAPAGVRSAVAQGCILCGEDFLAQKKNADATKLYDTVRQADVPKQRLLEATRGAILARGTAGLPLLMEQLRSSDKAFYGIGLRTARELPGREITEALAAEMERSSPDHQGYLLLALADRHDEAVLPAILKAARSGSKKLRLVAVGVLDRRGDVATSPALLEAAASGDEELAQAAQVALARLPGNQVDTEVLARLPKSSGKMRQALITLAAQRRIQKALPAIVLSLDDTDPGIRRAAVQAVGVLGTDKEAASLVNLLRKTEDSKARGDIEMALIALSGRCGAPCVKHLLPIAAGGDSGLRAIGLHALAAAGGSDALAAVRTAVDDSDENVQDEAVRTLSTWPNNWPEDATIAEPLLVVARSNRKTSHQVLALRGYLQYLKGDKKINDAEKVAKISELLPLLKRPEEKRSAIAVIDTIQTATALELLMTFADDAGVVDDACSAIVTLTSKTSKAMSPEARQKALEVVVAKSTSDATKKKAGEKLKALKTGRAG